MFVCRVSDHRLLVLKAYYFLLSDALCYIKAKLLIYFTEK